MTTRAGEEELVAAIDDAPSARALAAERALVRALEADCHTPVGAHAQVVEPAALTLRAFVGRRRRQRLGARRARRRRSPSALGADGRRSGC